MPLFDYKCAEHGKFEDWQHWSVENVPCPKCSQPATKQVSMPAKTPGRWGDSATKYISAFGREMTSMEAAKEAEKRGLVSEHDLPKNYIEDRLEAQDADAASHNATMKDFVEKKAEFNGDASRAWSEVFSTDNMVKAGTLDSAALG
jgi:putative FmdB family regulatory protein